MFVMIKVPIIRVNGEDHKHNPTSYIFYCTVFENLPVFWWAIVNSLQLLRLVLDEARATLLTSISLLVTLQLLGICCAERELTGLSDRSIPFILIFKSWLFSASSIWNVKDGQNCGFDCVIRFADDVRGTIATKNWHIIFINLCVISDTHILFLLNKNKSVMCALLIDDITYFFMRWCR